MLCAGLSKLHSSIMPDFSWMPMDVDAPAPRGFLVVHVADGSGAEVLDAQAIDSKAPDYTPFPFLDLPAEIRVLVYAQMAVPHKAPMSVYHGLYLSCRQVKEEMEYECVKVMDEYTKKIEERVAADEAVGGRVISVSSTYANPDFANIRTVTICIPPKALIPDYDHYKCHRK